MSLKYEPASEPLHDTVEICEVLLLLLLNVLLMFLISLLLNVLLLFLTSLLLNVLLLLINVLLPVLERS